MNKTVAGPSGVGISKEMIDEVMKTFEDNLPIGLMIDLVFTGVYALLVIIEIYKPRMLVNSDQQPLMNALISK